MGKEDKDYSENTEQQTDEFPSRNILRLAEVPSLSITKDASENAVSKEFLNVDDETLEKSISLKLGIVGGKGVGKSYLFHSMVYRACSPGRSGAMSYFLQNGKAGLASATRLDEKPINANIGNFIDDYTTWYKIKQTTREDHMWYRLRLEYKTGIFGYKSNFLDVRFFDGSGEGFFQAVNADNTDLWRAGFLNANIIVFCFPLWVAFPGKLNDQDWTTRKKVLEGFNQVVENYSDLRKKFNAKNRVKTILALTMADDRRSALHTLREKWITSYIANSAAYLEALKTGGGLARYLVNARKVSESVRKEFQRVNDARISCIPDKISFGAGQPWLIPLSAIDGSALESIENDANDNVRDQLLPPVPVHVELPLLVALCENNNALI